MKNSFVSFMAIGTLLLAAAPAFANDNDRNAAAEPAKGNYHSDAATNANVKAELSKATFVSRPYDNVTVVSGVAVDENNTGMNGTGTQKSNIAPTPSY
jgi:hypothetical protein